MKKEKKIVKKLVEWEIEVCFQANPNKDNDKFMKLLEDRIYDVIDEIAPESEQMSVFRVNF